MTSSGRLARQKTLWPALLLLLALLGAFEVTSFDLAVQDRLFDFERGRWLVDAAAALPRAVFYTGPKVLLIAFGLILLGTLLASRFRWPGFARVSPWRRRACAIVFLSLAIVPSTVAVLKATTHVYCPAEIRRYGGSVAYVRLLERCPPEDRSASPGRCFPAGHASGGFALLSLAAFFRTRRGQWIGIGLGLFAGAWMGFYQMAKGAHYLSHTVVTALLAWIIFLLVERLLPLPHDTGVSRTGAAANVSPR